MSRPIRLKFALAMGASVAVTAVAMPAMAQDAPTAADRGRAAIEEIVVTAQRRVEKLQNVPIAATVLNSADLAERGVTDLQTLQYAAAGLSISPPGNGETFVNIRGVGSFQTGPTASAGVAYYVDGVFIPVQRFSGDNIFDIASIEVLRGPQGTLVGENSTGGALLIKSAQPRLDETAGHIDVILGNYARRRVEAALNLPISSTLAARASALVESRNSYTTNLGSGNGAIRPNSSEQPGNYNSTNVRLQLAWHPSDDFDATLRFDAFRTNDDGPAIKPVANPLTDPFSASIQDQPFIIAYDTPQYAKSDGTRTALEMNYHFAGVTLRSITSYAHAKLLDSADTDYGRSIGANQSAFFVRDFSSKLFTQEINIISDPGDKLSWVLGGYYSWNEQPLQLTQLATPFSGAPTIPILSLDLTAKKTSRAVFAQADYKLTGNLSVTAGVRYSKNDAPFTAATTVPTPFGTFITLPTDTRAESDRVTVRAAANWQVTPDVLLYGSYATGYKAGGGNLGGFVQPPPFEPETNAVFEVGLKSTLLDRHLRLNLAAFTERYKNLQVQGSLAGFPLTVNAARAQINGLETEATVVFSGLRIDASATYLDGVTKVPFTIPTGFVAPGTRLPYMSEWSANLGVQYEIPLGAGSLTPRLQYVYASERSTLLTPAAYNEVDARNLLDFRATFKSGGNWQLEGYVTNLTDETYVLNITAPGRPGVVGLTYGAPREFGGRIIYRF